jgi:hypothetical protein
LVARAGVGEQNAVKEALGCGDVRRIRNDVGRRRAAPIDMGLADEVYDVGRCAGDCPKASLAVA